MMESALQAVVVLLAASLILFGLARVTEAIEKRTLIRRRTLVQIDDLNNNLATLNANIVTLSNAITAAAPPATVDLTAPLAAVQTANDAVTGATTAFNSKFPPPTP